MNLVRQRRARKSSGRVRLRFSGLLLDPDAGPVAGHAIDGAEKPVDARIVIDMRFRGDQIDGRQILDDPMLELPEQRAAFFRIGLGSGLFQPGINISRDILRPV